jgi:hypothetical protein
MQSIKTAEIQRLLEIARLNVHFMGYLSYIMYFAALETAGTPRCLSRSW